MLGGQQSEERSLASTRSALSAPLAPAGLEVPDSQAERGDRLIAEQWSVAEASLG